MERNLGIIKKNLVVLNSFFKKYSNKFSWKSPKAGPIAFPSLKDGGVGMFCHDLVTQAGVLLLPGTLYDTSSSNFRIEFGRNNLKECVQKFEEYLQDSK